MKNFSLDINTENKHNKLPWLTFIFIRLVFYIPAHDFFYTIKNRIDVSINIANSLEQGTLRPRIALILLTIFSIIIILRYTSRSINFRSPLIYLIAAFFTWATLSITWADDQFLTLRRIVAAGMLSLGAFACAKKFSLREILYLAFFCSAVSWCISFIAEISLNTFQPWHPDYRFSGTQHPNEQSWDLVVMFISGMALIDYSRKFRWLYILATFIALVFIILTKSRTAFFSILCALLAYLALRLPIKLYLATTLGCLSCCSIILLLFPDSGINVFLLGREDETLSTLTYRTPLWTYLLNFIQENPIIGYGFNGFWTTNRVFDVENVMGWFVFHAHNTYLELLLGIGVIGLILYNLILIISTAKAIKCYRTYHNSIYAFFFAVLIFLFSSMMVEVLFFTIVMPFFICLLILAKLIITPVPLLENRGIIK